MIVPLYKGKGGRNGCKNYRGIWSLKRGWKNICRDPNCPQSDCGLIDDTEGAFREGREWVDQIFTLKQISQKAREKKP